MSLALERRRGLRAESTDAERCLWTHLRGRRLLGFKFRRQFPCGPFILDFYCPERRLAIEVDGSQHFEPAALDYDRRRTRFLESRGIRVLRFPSNEALSETEGVLERIADALEAC